MDRAAALLAALRATADLGDAKLDPARVEALAGALGLDREELPVLVQRWQKTGRIAVSWGGILEVLPEAAPSGGVVINNQGANFGLGATIAGHNATGGTVTITVEMPDVALGALAAVTVQLQVIRPGLQGEAAAAADAATQSLNTPPATGAPAEVRRAWANDAGKWLGRLLTAAPQARAVVELGEKALKALGWG